MKRLLLAVTMLILGLTGLRQAEAGANVSIDFFYDNIGSDGAWVELDDHGYCWQPTVAVSNAKWRPYSDGYWVYTDVGWTWVSYEEFGWATYHYGRWVRLRDRGWFWVPGREWGPAWVSWRTGGDYVGWAPLPPRGRGEVEYDNRPIHGQVDVEFDIGPSYYNFVEVRYIGEPVLRERIFESSMNVTYISSTVNVTNITYTNSVVYNHGPDYDTVSRYSMRPVRRMRLEREANADLTVAARSNSLLKVQGDRLVVAAPAMFEKPAKPIAPKVVKEKISKPTVERGWDVVADPKAQAEMKEKMKKEDPKNIPPPSIKPNDNAAAAQTPGAVSAPGTMPAAGASPVMPPDQDKGKDKRLENASPIPAAPGSSPGTTPPAKSKKEQGDKPAATPPSTGPGNTPAPTPAKPPSERQRTAPSSLVTSPDGTPFREPEKHDQEAKKEKQTEKAPDAMPPTRQPTEPKTEKAPRQPKAETPDAMPPTRQPTAPPTEKAPRKPKTEPTQAPSTRQPEAQAKPPVPPPPQMAPAKREAPPEAPPKPAPPDMSKARTAPPPPPPAANQPVKAEPPPSKGGDKKGKEPAPSPGP